MNGRLLKAFLVVVVVLVVIESRTRTTTRTRNGVPDHGCPAIDNPP
jgi:hypothetical protein